MANSYARFLTPAGEGIVLELSQMVACWEGKVEGTTVFHIAGVEEPIVVLVDFEDFTDDFISYIDYRVPKEKPGRKPGSSPKLVVSKD